MNILNILKDKPKSKLYSPILGECELANIQGMTNIRVIKDSFYYNFNEEGKYSADGECLLFPSNEMRDWNKFAWKKGDVLTIDDKEDKQYFLYFDKWVNDDCTHFYGKLNNLVTHGCVFNTCDYTLASEEDAKNYMDKTKKKFKNYNVNLETLDIEEKQEHEFKPFEKVLVRDMNNDKWRIDLFMSLQNTFYKYSCLKNDWQQCIPYEGNEHLLNTANPA